MEVTLRQLIVGLALSFVLSMYLLSDQYEPASSDGAEPTLSRAKDASIQAGLLQVWGAEEARGKTWGETIAFQGDGVGGRGTACALRFDGAKQQACGLNWKGWFPEDACDDASSFKSLVFYIRQTSQVADADLTVHLMDNIKRPQKLPVSNGLSILKDSSVTQIDSEWRKVVLPLERLAKNTTLDLKRLWGIDFSYQGTKDVTFLVDRISFSNETVNGMKFPASASYTATAVVRLQATTYPIRDEIYGVCDLPADKLALYGLKLSRWGGNRTSRYNWEKNADNAGKDWYFKNGGFPIRDSSENAYARFVKQLQSVGAAGYITVPTLGIVAKDHASYSYSIRKYGPQKASETGHPDVGNGVTESGRPITVNDFRDASIIVGPDFIAEGVKVTTKAVGRDGVRYWVLDNEPMLWHETHRDVRQKPMTYEELWERTVKYAEAIRAVDPTAKIAGFCSWGWTDLFCSAADEGGDNYRTRPDCQAHGGMPLAEWFIHKCGEYKQKHGKPLIDVMDCHWYPEAEHEGRRPYKGTGMNLDFNNLRLRSTRELWDATYQAESWIKHSGDAKPAQLLPRVRGWIEKHNPGMELCIGEYNFGGGDNITGALAQAETFGVFAREKTDLAFIWTMPEGTQELAWKLFRNYDSKGGRFGDRFVPCESNHPDVSIFTAKRRDGATTIVLVNKNLGGACQLKLDAAGLRGAVKAYRFDQDTEEKVVEALRDTKTIDGTLNVTLPAASATILVVE